MKTKFNIKADSHLKQFYKKFGSKTWKQKYNLLSMVLGGRSNFSHKITWKQKCGLLEYEYLELEGLIEIEYH